MQLELNFPNKNEHTKMYCPSCKTETLFEVLELTDNRKGTLTHYRCCDCSFTIKAKA